MTVKSTDHYVTNYRSIMVCVFLIAAFLRLYGLNNLSPPGLEHDEVAHWLINRDIQSGNLGIYYSEAYGHEAGFHYIQTAFMSLMGDNAVVLRLPSAFAGLLLVAISFALARKLFGIRTGLLSASLLAITFWPVFYSRLALRAIALPLTSAFSAYFWWKAWQMKPWQPGRSPKDGEKKDGSDSTNNAFRESLLASSLTWYALAGLFAGLTIYTYMASRVLPIFFVLFFLYLALFHKKALSSHWRSVLLFAVIYVVVAGPMVLYLLSNPGVESRIGEVDAPLIALAEGELKPVFDNGLKAIAMFGFRGDPLWRQNVAYLPVFGPVVALLFYIGLAISVWKLREPTHLFIILWLFTSTIPSIVTIDAPSSIRIINALPIVTIFPAIGLQVIHFFPSLSTISTKLSTEKWKFILLLLLVALFTFNIIRTATAIFQTWPADNEVQFVWQKAFTEVAGYLDDSFDDGPVAIGGWTPETMDPPTMELSLIRQDLELRFFDPTQSLIIPTLTGELISGQTARIFHPTALPLQPALADLLTSWAGISEIYGDFTLYHLEQVPELNPQYPNNVLFGDEITYLGYDLDLSSEPQQKRDAAINLITYWQVDGSAGGPRRIFLHLLDEYGEIIDQDDSLGVPTASWAEGDIILQRLSLSEVSRSEMSELRMGIYDPETGIRLLTQDGHDFVVLASPPFRP